MRSSCDEQVSTNKFHDEKVVLTVHFAAFQFIVVFSDARLDRSFRLAGRPRKCQQWEACSPAASLPRSVYAQLHQRAIKEHRIGIRLHSCCPLVPVWTFVTEFDSSLILSPCEIYRVQGQKRKEPRRLSTCAICPASVARECWRLPCKRSSPRPFEPNSGRQRMVQAHSVVWRV